MSHTIFQSVYVSPIPACNKPLSSSKRLFPSRISFFRPIRVPIKLRIGRSVVKACSSSSVVDDDAIKGLERCLASDLSATTSSSGVMYGPVMKGGQQYGAFGGATTLEKSKLDLTQKQTKSSPEVCLFSFRVFGIVVVFV